MQIDPNTGLPELPEGYFWRVQYPETHYGMGFFTQDKNSLEVRLMKKSTASTYHKGTLFRKGHTSTQDTTRYVDREMCKGTNKVAVSNAANRVMKSFIAAQEASKMVGDYPPKKLETP